jgi:hypothetical protein
MEFVVNKLHRDRVYSKYSTSVLRTKYHSIRVPNSPVTYHADPSRATIPRDAVPGQPLYKGHMVANLQQELNLISQ